MNKKNLTRIIVATAIVITAGGGYALGASTPFTLNSEGTFYACVTGVNGNITKVTNTPKTCPKGTVPISWNSVGPVGPIGAAGPKGDKGEKGDQGESSQGSNSGNWYLQSPDGATSYPVFNIGTAAFVSFSDSLIPVEDVVFYAAPKWKSGSIFQEVYLTDNCTGPAKIIGLSAPSKPVRESLDPVFVPWNVLTTMDQKKFGHSNINPNLVLADLKSFRVLEDFSCQSLDFQASYNKLASNVQSAKVLWENQYKSLAIPGVATFSDFMANYLQGTVPVDASWSTYLQDPNYIQMDRRENYMWHHSKYISFDGPPYSYSSNGTETTLTIYDFNVLNLPNIENWKYVVK